MSSFEDLSYSLIANRQLFVLVVMLCLRLLLSLCTSVAVLLQAGLPVVAILEVIPLNLPPNEQTVQKARNTLTNYEKHKWKRTILYPSGWKKAEIPL